MHLDSTKGNDFFNHITVHNISSLYLIDLLHIRAPGFVCSARQGKGVHVAAGVYFYRKRINNILMK